MNKDQLEGKVEEVVGKFKQGVGELWATKTWPMVVWSTRRQAL